MKPLSQMSLEMARAIRVVLTDIDDTVTTEGMLTAAAYGALERLHRAGFLVVPVTGRPAGWCDHIARMWPVDAVVGENGAFYFRYDRERKTMQQRFWASPEELKRNRAKLEAIETEVLASVPGTALASDQAYRMADLAIDFCEDVPALPEAEVDRIVSIFERAGAQAKVSSIHVNGWFGDYNKHGLGRGEKGRGLCRRFAERRAHVRSLSLERRRRQYPGLRAPPDQQAGLSCEWPLGRGFRRTGGFAAQGERRVGTRQTAPASIDKRISPARPGLFMPTSLRERCT
jgi:HAD superfamily hydrolase (TIGR01484 family)